MTSSFADDTKDAKQVNYTKDTAQLQDLNTIKARAAENMFFNENRFEVLKYGTNNNIKESTSYSTTQGITDTNTSLHDLEATVSNESKFSLHTHRSINKNGDQVGY